MIKIAILEVSSITPMVSMWLNNTFMMMDSVTKIRNIMSTLLTKNIEQNYRHFVTTVMMLIVTLLVTILEAPTAILIYD